MGSGREVRDRNTNAQTPSSREIPKSKHQKPSSKHQRNPKFQAPNRGPRFELGTWSLELLWCLVLGVWSLDFGVWSFNRPTLHRWGVTIYVLRLAFQSAFSVCVSWPLALTWRHANHPMLSNPRSPLATGSSVGPGASRRRLTGRRRGDGRSRQQSPGCADNRA